MKPMAHRFSLAFLAVSLLVAMPVVAEPATERVRLGYLVQTVTPAADGRVEVTARIGKFDRPFVGAVGQVLAAHHHGGHGDHSATAIGSAEVIAVEAFSMRVSVVPAFPGDSVRAVMVGDMLELPIDAPIARRGVLFDMMRFGLMFLDADGREAYSRDLVLIGVDGSYEDGILRAFAEIPRGTERQVRDMPEYESLREPLATGQYAGRSVFQVMAGASPEDVVHFLGFIRSYPGKYLGGTWRFDETFATWALNAAPYGSDQLRDILLAEDDAAARRRLAVDAGSAFVDDDFYEAWSETALEWARTGRQADAGRLLERAQEAAMAVQNRAGAALALVTRGRLSLLADDTDGAMRHFTAAHELLEALGDAEGLVRVAAFAAAALIDAERYEEALEQYTTLADLRGRQVAAGPTPARVEALGRAQLGRGSALRRLGRTAEAIAAYEEAASSFAGLASRAGLELQAFTLLQLGRQYGTLGDHAAALDRHDQALTRYRALGDQGGEADAHDYRGAQLVRLGRNEEAIAAFMESHRLDIQREHWDEAGYSMSEAAQAHWRLGRIEQAIAAHREAIGLRERAGQVSGQAWSWSMLGSLYQQAGLPTEAFQAYERAAALYAQVDSVSGRASVLDDLGDLYLSLQEHARAITHYREAAELFESISASAELAVSLGGLGNAYWAAQQWPQAREAFERSLALQRASGYLEGQVYNLVNLGQLASFLDLDHATGTAHHREAVRLAAATGSSGTEGYALMSLGRHLRGQAEYAEAHEVLTRALTLHRQSGDRGNEAQTLAELSELQVLRGDFAGALATLEQARALAREAGRATLVAETLQSAGFIVMMQGDYRQALEYQNEAMALHEEAGNPWGIASAHVGLGNIANQRADYRAAIEHYATADRMFAEIGAEQSRATPANNTGTIYFWQGDYERSLEYFRRTRELLDALGIEDDFVALVATNTAEVLVHMQRYDEAEAELARGLRLAERLAVPRTYAAALLMQGQLALERERYAEARAPLEHALRLTEASGEGTAIIRAATQLGRMHAALGELPAAAAALDRALAEAGRMDAGHLRWQPLYRRALVHQALGEKERAVALLEQAVEVLSELQAGFVGGEEARRLFATGRDRQAVYESLGDLLFDLGRFSEAQYYFQRDTDEQLRQQRADVRFQDAATEAVAEEARRLRTERDLARSQAQRLQEDTREARHAERAERLAAVVTIRENEYQRFLGELSREQPELTSLVARTLRPEELALHMERLPEDIAVVTYWMGAEQLFATVLTSDGIAGKRIPVRYDALRQQVEQLYALVQRPGGETRARRGMRAPEVSETLSGDLDELSTALYQLLIEPVEEEIAGRARLAILPSGPLSYLPFALLGRPDDEGRMRYLAEEVTPFYLSTLATLSSGPPRQDALRIIAFGNADRTLDSAELEVRALAEAFPDAQVYLREEATRQRVEQLPPGFNVLHLATHGVLDYVDPERTYLALAPDAATGDDGHFTITDIYSAWGVTGLRGYRLVTLSACNTALTAPGAEEALVRPAPAYAFLSTGARSAVATLWEVDDEATARFMEIFYAHVAEQGVADALRTAQLRLRTEHGYEHPFYWAPFMLLGHWH